MQYFTIPAFTETIMYFELVLVMNYYFRFVFSTFNCK